MSEPRQAPQARPPFEWSPAKQRLFRFGANTVVSAAAGSGKTTALVELYLRLLEGLPPEQHGPGGLGPDGRPLEPEEIVVVTFTEKAAQDLTRKIREGLLARLDQAQALPDPAARRTLSARWEEARARLAVAPIGTIHSCAARLLREHPVEAGVDPGFEVLDQADADTLRREAAADVVRDALERRDAALALLLGHLPLADQGEYPGLESSLVDALSRLRGAGTSVEQLRQATRARLAELEADRMRLAAGLEAAAAALRGVPAAQPFLAAWDALPEAACRLAPDLDGAAWQPLLALAPLAKNWRGAGSRDPMRKVLSDTLDELPAIYWQRAATPLGDAFLALLARVESAYETRKQRRRALDFDDLEEGAVRLLRRDRDAGGTLLASRPAVVLVDEFQDNNRRQLELVRLLAGDGVGRLRDRTLAVVGDPKQSIYRFRGADVSVFRRITELVTGDAGAGGEAGAGGAAGSGSEARAGSPAGAGGGAGPLRFSENFRSVPGIITFVNALFARYMGPPDPARPPYEVPFDPEKDALGARRPAVGGAGGAAPAARRAGAPAAGLARELGGGADTRAAGAAVEGGISGAASGAAVAAVELICLPASEPAEIRRAREAEAAVRRIRQLIAGGFRPGQIAVLMRTLQHAQPLQRGLEAAGIPAYVVKGSGFYGASEVRDVLCLLASLDSQLDDLSLAAVLRSPFAGISDDALLLVARPDPAARPRPLHRAFREGRLAPPVPALPETDRARLAAFAAWHHELRGRKDRTPLPELIEEALERSGYATACLTRAGGDQQLANLRKLAEQARAFEARPGRTLRDFVRDLERAVSEEPRETAAQVVGESEDVVRIMTIHAAKGLEFPVVVVPGCADRMPDDTGPVVLDEDPEAGGLALRPVDPATLETAQTWLARRLGEARRQKARAEWRRLFYVAATRARDRLILVGEHPVRRDGSPSEVDTWRREVDALLADSPELEATGVVRRVRWEELGEVPEVPELPELPGTLALRVAPESAKASARAPGSETAESLEVPERLQALEVAEAPEVVELGKVPEVPELPQAPRPSGPGPAAVPVAAQASRAPGAAVGRAEHESKVPASECGCPSPRVARGGAGVGPATWVTERAGPNADAASGGAGSEPAAGVPGIATPDVSPPAARPRRPEPAAAVSAAAGRSRPPEPAPSAPVTTTGDHGPADTPDAAVEAVARWLRWRPARPTRFVHTVTELAEFAACPHRYYLTRRLGLSDAGDPWFDGGDEPQETAGGAGRWPDEDGLDGGEPAASPGPAGLTALDRGSLAHAVLEHVPLGLDGAELASCVRELIRQYAAALPGSVPGVGGASGSGGAAGSGSVSGSGGPSGAGGVRGSGGASGFGDVPRPGRVSGSGGASTPDGVSGSGGLSGPGRMSEAEQDALAARITAFLKGPTGRALARAWGADPGRVLREYPFAMRLADDGATLIVHGKIDVLWQDDGGSLHLIDYKTARGQGGEAAQKYEFQLLTYALAAGRLAGSPVSRAGIVFLLGEPAEPAWLDAGSQALAGLEARAVALARRIAGLEQEARDSEGWPRIARPECERLGCGFVAKCYGTHTAGTARR